MNRTQTLERIAPWLLLLLMPAAIDARKQLHQRCCRIPRLFYLYIYIYRHTY